MASTQLLRTQETPTSTNKYTWSAWIKRGTITNGQVLVYNYLDSNNRGYVMLEGADKLFFYDKYGGSEQTNVYSTRVFRDTFGWYHIHIKADSTQASESDRFQVHINGVLETLSGSGSGTIISQNDTLGFAGASGCLVALGSNADSVANGFDGIMSHVHYVDGLALPYTDFGSTDATTGEWKINTSPTISDYGNSGYFMLKDDNSVNDDSGKGNNFAVTGTLTKTEDCPSNVFATFNPLHNTSATMSNGNLTAQSTNSNYISGVSTLGTKTGKFYAEFKLIAEGASGESVIGVTALVRPTSAIVAQTGNFGIRNNNGLNYYTSGGTAFTATSQHNNFTVNDIIGVALDMDNGRVYFSKNGGWWNGASTWTGTSPSSYITLQTDIYDEFFFECGDAAAGQNANWSANFGNGYFGTTQISSEGTNASGIGKFEYDVPTGYTALSTKGLNE